MQTADEVKVEVATTAGESNKRMAKSLTLLRAVQSSFKIDQVEQSSASHSAE